MKNLTATFSILLCFSLFFVVSTSTIHAQTEETGAAADAAAEEREAIESSRVVAGTVSDATYEPLVNIPGVSDSGNRTLADFLNALFRVLLGVGAILAVVRITIAGLQYMASETSVGSKEAAKETITNSVLGLLLLLIIFLVLQVINPRLTDISFLDGAILPSLTTIPDNSSERVTGGSERRVRPCESELTGYGGIRTTCSMSIDEIAEQYEEFAEECEGDGGKPRRIDPNWFDRNILHTLEANVLVRYFTDQDSNLDVVFYCQPPSGIATNFESVTAGELDGTAVYDNVLRTRIVGDSVQRRILTQEEAQLILTDPEKGAALREEIRDECIAGRDNYTIYEHNTFSGGVEFYCYQFR